MVTALARVEGRPLGVIANNPAHLAGAIDSDGADKAARFMQLCDAFDLPILFLCRHAGDDGRARRSRRRRWCATAARMFVTGANLTVPFVTIVLRKGYGLGAQAMAGGSIKAPLCVRRLADRRVRRHGPRRARCGSGTAASSTRSRIRTSATPSSRRWSTRMYQHGKALNTATHFEIDDVIDPADTRTWMHGDARSRRPRPAARRQEAPEHRHLVGERHAR